MLTGTPITSPPHIRLMALAEGSSPEKRHHHSIMSSLFGGSFRESIRNSFRLWGSADNLDNTDEEKPRLTAKSRPKSQFFSNDYLMPPPAALPKSRTHSDTNAPYPARCDIRKSESDPNIMESTEAAYV